MPNVNQIHELTNELTNLALGKKTDGKVLSGDYITIGKEVLSSDENTDSFYRALNDVIAEQETSVKPYKAEKDPFFHNNFEYGIIRQKIYVDMPEAVENHSWDPLSKAHSDPFEKFGNMIRVSFFEGLSSWELPQTIPDIQLKTAFLGPTQMAAFIEGLTQARINSMQMKFEGVSYLARATLMARISKTPTLVVRLLSAYNATPGVSLTAEQALMDKKFLTYSSSIISQFVDRFKKPSKLFNAKGYERHSNKPILTVLGQYATSVKFFAEAMTIYKDLIALPNYYTVPYWLDGAAVNDFEKLSKIELELDGNSTIVNNAVALLCDEQSIGTTVERERTRSIYNPRDEYNNYFNKAEINYFNDLSENAVLFVLE